MRGTDSRKALSRDVQNPTGHDILVFLSFSRKRVFNIVLALESRYSTICPKETGYIQPRIVSQQSYRYNKKTEFISRAVRVFRLKVCMASPLVSLLSKGSIKASIYKFKNCKIRG